MTESILYELNSHVAKITLNRPDNGNVVNVESLNLLYRHVNNAINSPDCRVIVIQGAGRVFSRGMDFEYLLQQKTAGKLTTDFSEPYIKAVMQIRNSPKPVIAAVDGEVLAGGMGIALACDIVIATKRSLFGLSEVIFGIIPAYVFPFLFERVHFKRARFMVLCSEKFNAQEAYEFGVADALADNDKLEKKLRQYIKRLLASSPSALLLTKSYSDKIFHQHINEAVKSAGIQLTELLNNSKNTDAIKSFLDGEKLPWMVKYQPRSL